MKDESIRISLQAIARRDIPEDINLWPRLASLLERKDITPMTWKWKLVWMILLVLLALSALTGVTYAFYHYFTDAGLQSVSDSGLLSTVNATTQPTRNPTVTPPEPVTVIGNSQTLAGVSLTLEWVYLMDGQQAFGFTADGLEGGKTLGMPAMGFGILVPVQYRGAALAVKDDTQPVAGTYVVNQIVRDENTFGKTDTRTDVRIDIPLLDGNGQVLNTFRFEIKNELVHAGPFAGGNTYSTRANGLEMSLDWIILSSQNIQARLCFTPPDGKDWSLVSPTIQLGADPNQVASSIPVEPSQSTTDTSGDGIRCQKVTFPVSTKGAQAFLLTAGDLATSAGETLKGDWTYNWNQLPDQMQFPGIAPLDPPLGAETIGSDMTVALEKAYADIYRMIFVLYIKTPQEGFVVSSATLKDSSGTEINTGLGISSPPDDPTRFTIEIYPYHEFAAGQFKGELTVEIGTQFGGSSSQAEAHFALDLPVYPAIVFDPMQTVKANGVEMLLQRVKVTPSYTKVYLCFQKPTPADWAIGYRSSLKIGEDTGNLTSVTLIFDAPTLGNLPINPEPDWSSPIMTGRCVTAGFTVGHHNRPEVLTLNIGELEQSPSEVIPEDQIQAARQKLLAQGIDMDWVTSSGNGGGGGGPVIHQKPDGMTDEQVMTLFYEAMGYYYPGPWTFSVDIKP
jgi:hypothetical protein